MYRNFVFHPLRIYTYIYTCIQVPHVVLLMQMLPWTQWPPLVFEETGQFHSSLNTISAIMISVSYLKTSVKCTILILNATNYIFNIYIKQTLEHI